LFGLLPAVGATENMPIRPAANVFGGGLRGRRHLRHGPAAEESCRWPPGSLGAGMARSESIVF